MKRILPALTALTLLTAAPLAWPADTPPPAATSVTEGLSAPRKITRWEDSGMKPAEAREWESYSFKPHDAIEWKRAGFAPVVARTWSDKGFDPDEAAEWRDSTRNNRTMMSELDQSDPAQWKREGFTPRDRLAWWEAGFAFEDAVTLTRAGMSPADAAWHGHEKLKELKRPGGEPAKTDSPSPGGTASSWTLSDLLDLWNAILPHLKTGLIIALTLVSCGLALYVRRIHRSNRRARKETPPDSTTPDSAAETRDAPPEEADTTPPSPKPLQFEDRRHPARRTSFWTPVTPTCVHCQSTNVRMSRINPRKIAGIRFSEYFRCRSCGRHFSNVSYAPLVAAAMSLVIVLTLSTAGFIHLITMTP